MYIVTGSNGLLGKELRRQVGDNPHYRFTTRENLDILNSEMVKSFYTTHPDSITVHLAAYTATKNAETEREKCYQTNVVGTRNIALAADKLLYVSSDHVFSGVTGNYSENDEPCPWNHYGWTKLAGEHEACRARECKIVRCSFRPRPYPYRVAYGNVYTTAMWVDDMARKLLWCLEYYDSLPPVLHMGGIRQTYYEFAVENGPVEATPAPDSFPRDLSLDTTVYHRLRTSQ